MNIEKKLLDINDYYEDELTKALGIMWQLQCPYSTIEIPDRLHKEIANFADNFKFKYHDRD